MDKHARVREAFLRERNIEPVARALCAKELGAVDSVSADDVPGLVDRLWPAVAAQLAAGLRDDAGNTVPHSVAVGLAAWEDWLDSRPAARWARAHRQPTLGALVDKTSRTSPQKIG